MGWEVGGGFSWVMVVMVLDLELKSVVSTESKREVERSEVDGWSIEEREPGCGIGVWVLVIVLVLVVGTEIFMGSVLRLRTSRMPVQVTLPQS